MSLWEILEDLHKREIGFCLQHKPAVNLYNLSIDSPVKGQKYFYLKSCKEVSEIIRMFYPEQEEEEEFDL